MGINHGEFRFFYVNRHEARRIASLSNDLRLPALTASLSRLRELSQPVGDAGELAYLLDLLRDQCFEFVSPRTGLIIKSGGSVILRDQTVLFSFPAEASIAVAASRLGEAFPLSTVIDFENQVAISTSPNVWDLRPGHLQILSSFMPRWNATKHSGNEMICVIGHQNFAHYASNQLPAVALLPRLGVGGNVTLLETYRPLGAIRSLFPELDLEVTQVAAGALENVNKPGLLIVPLGSLRLTKDIRDRVLRHAEARLGPQTISIIKKVNRTQPCLWVSVRTVNRTASNQHELLLALCRRFLREYGAAHVIIDGHSLPADFALDEGAADSRDVVAADLAVARAIKQELDVDGEQERVHLAVGLSILETLFLGHLANFYFCHYGTIQHKIGWFHSCAGVIHSNSALLEAAYPVALRSEVAVPPVYLPPETVVDESPDTSGDERQLALKHNGYFVHVHTAVNFVMNTYRKAMAARPNYLRRDQVIQSYLDLFDHANYLEIGVFSGDTFHAVRAAAKVAVDPRFRIDPEDREAGATYCEITSNEYFAELPAHVHSLFHVIFLDGLHTFEQTLRDLLNAIQILHQGGVIVIDDIWPNSYPASLTDWREIAAVKEATGVSDQFWMGDVYRLVYFIQSFLPRFRYATCENNHGQLVMWRASRGPEQLPERRIEDIARMEFRHIVTQRDVFNFLPNAEIVRRVRESMPHGGRDEASLLMPRGE